MKKDKEKNEIDKRSFNTYQKKLKIENYIKSGLFAIFSSFGFMTILSLFLWIFNLKINWIVIVITVIVLVVTFLIGHKKLFVDKDKNIAKRVDNLGLEDRVVTMVQFKDDESLIAKLQRKDAESNIKKIEPKKVKFSFPLFLTIPTVVSIVLGLASIIFVPERTAKAEPLKTAYTITFNSNGGEFDSNFLFDKEINEEDIIIEKSKNYKGEEITCQIITLKTEYSHNKKKNISSNSFANNKEISYRGHSLIGWNNKLVNDNGTEVSDTLNYMSNGLDVPSDTTFYAIWQSVDDIIKDLLDDLRDIVDEADINPELKTELNESIDNFEKEILDSSLSNEEKLEKTNNFKDEIINKINDALNKITEANKGPAEILIEGGKNIGSDALVDLGESIKESNSVNASEALDKIIDETKDLNGEELNNKIQEISGVLKDAADSARENGNIQLAEALENLRNNLLNAGEEASKGNNDTAHEIIKDAVEQAKDEIKVAIGEKKNIENVKEDISESIEDAISKIEGQTGEPKEDENENQNSSSDSMSDSGMNSGETSGNSGMTSGNSGETSGNSGMTSGNSGMTSGNSGMTSGNSGMTSGNSGETSGNSGMTSGNSGQTSGHSGQTSGHSGNNSEYTSTDKDGPGKKDDQEKIYDNVIDGQTPFTEVFGESKEEILIKLENGEIPEEYIEIIKNYLESLGNE